MENYEKKFVVNHEGDIKMEEFTDEESEKLIRKLSSKKGIIALDEKGNLVLKDSNGLILEVLNEKK
ncbi:hypothetical protein KJ750_00370 [Patescibacteria group bacterium]|nr:hypothetical protein [Patescibacteria group bacterium]MBU2263105.1 hypothetical protein [Patescibacteria group bacterium]